MVAAEEEFAARGLALARVQAIARAAGVSKQLIYHYFETKEELHHALLERITARHVGLFDIDEYRLLIPEDALRLFVARMFSIQQRNGGHLIPDLAMDGIGQRLPRGGGQVVRDIADCLADIVRRGQAQGAFCAGVESAALLVMINIVTNGAAAIGGYLINLIYADDSDPPPLQRACADWIVQSVRS